MFLVCCASDGHAFDRHTSALEDHSTIKEVDEVIPSPGRSLPLWIEIAKQEEANRKEEEERLAQVMRAEEMKQARLEQVEEVTQAGNARATEDAKHAQMAKVSNEREKGRAEHAQNENAEDARRAQSTQHKVEQDVGDSEKPGLSKEKGETDAADPSAQKKREVHFAIKDKKEDVWNPFGSTVWSGAHVDARWSVRRLQLVQDWMVSGSRVLT
eukprot:TRINITY_DN4821_c0_g1_i1.p1 TRINITY_DN4821_c0_g1~~TRINITY_DN4821_c0_g1_i1.p1  ORF type:complete len:213 (+),score=27.97 TRINITY_DN4821_c0_g1_i1:67-705(+)